MNVQLNHLWEPPTKQFYPKWQSPRVLPSSQSAPSCIGSRPASRQSIRDGHPERQAVSDPAALLRQRTSENRPTSRSYDSQPAHYYRRLRERSRHGHQDEPAWSPPSRDRSLLFIPSSTVTVLILPVPATSGSPFKDYHEHLVWRVWSHKLYCTPSNSSCCNKTLPTSEINNKVIILTVVWDRIKDVEGNWNVREFLKEITRMSLRVHISYMYPKENI
jgi:hypothetical protein